MFVLLSVLCLAGCLSVGQAELRSMCQVDKMLTGAETKQVSFTIPHDPDDMKYWRNPHLFYYLFGEFTGKPRNEEVTAVYRDHEGKAMYEATVDCAAKKWTTRVHSKEENMMKTWKTGDLKEPCKEGIFDIILKVAQPKILKFLWNGQALDHTPVMKKMVDGVGGYPRPERLDMKVGARQAGSLHAEASGDRTEFTRLAFGKCNAWPDSMTNCQEVADWVKQRGKQNVTGGQEGDLGSGGFGAYNNYFDVDCLKDSEYWMWISVGMHPNRDSKNAWCCCTDMRTGKLYNKDTHCQLVGQDVCSLTCTETYDKDLALEFLGGEESEEEALKEASETHKTP